MTPLCAERPLAFACAGETLMGVLSQPENPAALGVLVVVGGPQYRAGSHRQFVSMARALAANGYPALRFDVRGMGDSGGARRSFEDLDDDIAAAIDAFAAAPGGPRKVVLWGLCDGASAALLYAARRDDPRVAALALLNPWVRSVQSLARTQVKHYYLQRLRQKSFWTKLLSGGVAGKALRELLGNVRTATARAEPQLSYQQRMAAGWRRFAGPRMLLISEADLTAREFLDHSAGDADWREAMRLRPAQVVTLPGADHTCSTPGAQRAAERALVEWLARLPPLH